MQQWQYLSVILDTQTLASFLRLDKGKEEPEWHPLDELGREGWELVAIHPAEIRQGHPLTAKGAASVLVPRAVLKRPRPGSTDEAPPSRMTGGPADVFRARVKEQQRAGAGSRKGRR